MAQAKLPWVLLAVSLALNLFFAGGVVYTKLTAEGLSRGSDERLAAVVERLDLSDDDRAGLEALRERMRARIATLREERQEGRETLLAELGRPRLDRTRVREVIADGMSARAALFEELLVELHDYLGTLSREQRRAFLEMAEERGFMRGLFRPERRRP